MSRVAVFRLKDCPCGHWENRSWFVPPANPTCPACGNPRTVTEDAENYTAHVPTTAMKRFKPHFSRQLGVEVESQSHWKHLLSVHGVQEVELGRPDSDGYPDIIARDWDKQAKYHADRADRLTTAIAADPLVELEAKADEDEFRNDPVTEVGLEIEVAQ